MTVIKVKCARCGCGTGASVLVSIQRRIKNSMTPIWREASCKIQGCECHKTSQGAKRASVNMQSVDTKRGAVSMMYWIAVALLWLLIWAALTRLRVCGAHDWERSYVCTGTYLLYPHSDNWVEWDYGPEGQLRITRGPHSNHVWTDMEVLHVG